jgi:hypothetical protein
LNGVRTCLYLYLRFHSFDALYYWEFIGPPYFNTIFITDTLLTMGILYFVYRSTLDDNSKKYGTEIDTGKVLDPVG